MFSRGGSPDFVRGNEVDTLVEPRSRLRSGSEQASGGNPKACGQRNFCGVEGFLERAHSGRRRFNVELGSVRDDPGTRYPIQFPHRG